MVKKAAIVILLFSLHLFPKPNDMFFQLPNGLRVILSPVDHIEAACVLFYHTTGVRDDPESIRGATYLYKDLMVLGTQHLDPYDRVMFTKRKGGDGDIDINYDSSVFTQIVPMNELSHALWIEKERITSLQIPPRAIDTLKNNIYRIFYRLENSNIHFRASNWVKSVVFEGTHYQKPIYGDLESIRNIDNEKIRGVYRRFQDLSKIIMVVTGKFSLQQIRDLIGEYYGVMDANGDDTERTVAQVKPRNRYVYKNWVEENVLKKFVMYGFRAPSRYSLDYLYFNFLKYYLVDGRISKLDELLNDQNRLNVDISYEFTDNLESNALIIKIATPRRVDIEKSKYFVNTFLDRLKSKPIPQSDLREVKSLMEIDYKKDLLDIRKRSLLLAENYCMNNNLDYITSHSERIQRINAYDIVRISKKYFDKGNHVILNVYSK